MSSRGPKLGTRLSHPSDGFSVFSHSHSHLNGTGPYAKILGNERYVAKRLNPWCMSAPPMLCHSSFDDLVSKEVFLHPEFTGGLVHVFVRMFTAPLCGVQAAACTNFSREHGNTLGHFVKACFSYSCGPWVPIYVFLSHHPGPSRHHLP